MRVEPYPADHLVPTGLDVALGVDEVSDGETERRAVGEHLVQVGFLGVLDLVLETQASDTGGPAFTGP